MSIVRLLLVAALLPATAFAQFSDQFETPLPVDPNPQPDVDPIPEPEPEPVCGSAPSGFRIVEKRWEDIFYGQSWPYSPSFLTPIGSWTYRDRYAKYGKPAAGRVLTTSFVADANNHKLSFVGPQPVPAAGYPIGQTSLTQTVTLGSCRADMYAPCQVTARSGVLYYGPTVAIPECRTVPGETYWITWHNAAADFSPTTNSCSPMNASGGVMCDSNFLAR